MAYQVYLRHLNRAGTVKSAAITDFQEISYSRVVNGTSTLRITVDFSSRIIADLEPYDIFEVWMENKSLGMAEHLDFEAIWRGIAISTNADGITTAILTCPEQLSILDYRVVAWPSGVANRSTFSSVPAETLLKTLVDYNCTSLATVANGRTREGDLATGMGMTIISAPDLGTGNVISKTFSNKGLLPSLLEMAQIGGGDFTLIRQTGATWEFEFHTPTVGEDKRTGADRVEFSLSKGNMRNPRLTIQNVNEKSIAITGGQGKGSDRLYANVQGINYSADNDLELYKDARNQVDPVALADSGLADLNARERQRVIFDFDVIQTDAVFYSLVSVVGSKTYREGDYVTVVYAGTDYDRVVSDINIRITPSDTESPVRIAVGTQEIV